LKPYVDVRGFVFKTARSVPGIHSAFVFICPLEEEESGVEVSPTEVKMETALALLNNQACLLFYIFFFFKFQFF